MFDSKYYNDPREMQINPISGVTYEDDNRVEQMWHWGAKVLDLCNLPVSEYMKSIFLPNSTDVEEDKDQNDMTVSPKAVYDAIYPEVQTEQPIGGMLPNVLYDFGTITGDVTFLMADTIDESIPNQWYWIFDTSSPVPNITWPEEITTWSGGSEPTINENKHYEISFLDGVGVAMEV